MITHTGSYAIRAMVHILEVQGVDPADGNLTALEIARATGIPRNYLTKILSELVHVGLLTSTRGPRGGFRLVDGADRATLKDLLASFESVPTRGCFLCPDGCPEGTDCPSYDRCITLSGQVEQFLRTTRIADLISTGWKGGSSKLRE